MPGMIFVWKGKYATAKERKEAFSRAHVSKDGTCINMKLLQLISFLVFARSVVFNVVSINQHCFWCIDYCQQG